MKLQSIKQFFDDVVNDPEKADLKYQSVFAILRVHRTELTIIAICGIIIAIILIYLYLAINYSPVEI